MNYHDSYLAPRLRGVKEKKLHRVSGIRVNMSLFERHSLALLRLNLFSILVNNLYTDIEMKEDLENDLIEDKDACNDVKNDSKSSHVYLTQPSDNLNSYMVNKFHPPMAKSKQVPHESIDLSVYKPSAKCLGFTTCAC